MREILILDELVTKEYPELRCDDSGALTWPGKGKYGRCGTPGCYMAECRIHIEPSDLDA